MGGQKAQIRRYTVARIQKDDIAGYNMIGGDAAAAIVAQNRALRVDHGADCIQCLFGLTFLDKPDQAFKSTTAAMTKASMPCPRASDKSAAPIST
ncbi:hypothetical protein JCM17845_23200 [Iodidimonas gelatinilytica]|nr:hypothetical protein JCM17845_23200 [Iodidimonas gelatinilytica]